jgi:hypothetical protein
LACQPTTTATATYRLKRQAPKPPLPFKARGSGSRTGSKLNTTSLRRRLARVQCSTPNADRISLWLARSALAGQPAKRHAQPCVFSRIPHWNPSRSSGSFVESRMPGVPPPPAGWIPGRRINSALIHTNLPAGSAA